MSAKLATVVIAEDRAKGSYCFGVPRCCRSANDANCSLATGRLSALLAESGERQHCSEVELGVRVIGVQDDKPLLNNRLLSLVDCLLVGTGGAQ